MQFGPLGVGVLCCLVVGAGRHRYDRVVTFLVVRVFHPEDHLVLAHTELGLLTDRQEDRVFFVTGTCPTERRRLILESFAFDRTIALQGPVCASVPT
jgi:hypothetical protein